MSACMGWSDERVTQWSELLAVLHSDIFIPTDLGAGGHRRSPFVFRGMENACWPLKTSIERLGSDPTIVEQPSLRAFSKYAPPGTFSQNSDWERLAVAQHNGLPTRVLDWTSSPLIAAHFATAGREHSSADGAIWCVNTVIVRNHLLPPHMCAELRKNLAYLYDVKLLDATFPRLSDFDATSLSFRDLMLFFEPPSIDARIENQVGLLSVMNGSSKSHDDYLRLQCRMHPNLVHRIVIDRQAKPEIRDMLDQNNITERVLFPGLPGLCDWLKRYYGPAY